MVGYPRTDNLTMLDNSPKQTITEDLKRARGPGGWPLSPDEITIIERFLRTPTLINWLRARTIVLDPNQSNPREPMTLARAVHTIGKSPTLVPDLATTALAITFATH